MNNPFSVDVLKEAIEKIIKTKPPKIQVFYQVPGTAKSFMIRCSESYHDAIFVMFDGTFFLNGKEITVEEVKRLTEKQVE